MSARAEKGKLLRVLGLAFGVAAVVGGVVGQGILRSPGVAAQGLPYAELFLFIWAAMAVFVAVDAMSTVELAASIPRAGGPFAFAERAFGRFGGFLCGWLDAGFLILSTGYIAVVVAEYLQRLGLFAAAPTGVVAFAVVMLLGALNAAGTRESGAMQSGASAVKALALLGFAAICVLFRGEARSPAPDDAHAAHLTLAGVALAVVAVQQTYYGSNTAVYFSEEMNEPEKNMPRATFLGVAVVAVIYFAIVGSLVYVLPMPAIAASNLPVADALTAVVGKSGGVAATLFALFSVAAVGAIGLMQSTRTLFAMGRAGQLPAALALVAKNGTPWTAMALAVALAGLMAATGAYERLISITAPVTTVVSMLVGFAAIRMRMKEPDLARPWRMPFYPLPAVVTVLFNGGLTIYFTAADWSNTRWSFLFLLAALPVWWLGRNRRPAVAD